MKRVGRGVDHAGKLLDAVQLAEFGLGEHLLDRGAEAFVVDGSCEPASQTRGQMLETPHLEAVLAITGGAQPDLAHGQSAMGDNGFAGGVS